MEASQELAAGDVLMRFKAEVFQDEPRRGKNTNPHTRSTSARCSEIITVYRILPACAGIVLLSDGTCKCIGVCCFFLHFFYIFIQDKVAICLLVVGSPSWKRE